MCRASWVVPRLCDTAAAALDAHLHKWRSLAVSAEGSLLHNSCTNLSHAHICSDLLAYSADIQQFAAPLVALTRNIIHRPHVEIVESNDLVVTFSKLVIEKLPGRGVWN